MSTLIIHADRRPDRAGRPIPAGPSRSGRMVRRADLTPLDLARAARHVLRQRLHANDDLATVERIIRAHVPEAWEQLDRNALAALARVPPASGCHWCSAFVLAAGQLVDEPRHDEAHRELLGDPCSTCRRRQAIDRARRQAREEAQAAAAATAALPAARFCRTCGGSHRWQPATLTASAASPRVATGVIWAAGGGPPPEARALVAAATRAARPRRRRIATSNYRLLPSRRQG
jgi:hypothetical protein